MMRIMRTGALFPLPPTVREDTAKGMKGQIIFYLN